MRKCCIRRGAGGNVSWMLFQEGRSSYLVLSRGVLQGVLSRNVGARRTRVYCRQRGNWTRRRGLGKPEFDAVVREYVWTGRYLRKNCLSQKLGATLVGRELCIKSGWLPVQSPHVFDPCAARDLSSWHTITRYPSARAQFELQQS